METINPVAGIYAITNSVNGVQYIGSSRNIGARWKKHRAALNSGKHYNQRLQHAWNLFGATSFVFTILQESTSGYIWHLHDLEQQWLESRFREQGDHGYNQTGIASRPMATKLSK